MEVKTYPHDADHGLRAQHDSPTKGEDPNAACVGFEQRHLVELYRLLSVGNQKDAVAQIKEMRGQLLRPMQRVEPPGGAPENVAEYCSRVEAEIDFAAAMQEAGAQPPTCCGGQGWVSARDGGGYCSCSHGVLRELLDTESDAQCQKCSCRSPQHCSFCESQLPAGPPQAVCDKCIGQLRSTHHEAECRADALKAAGLPVDAEQGVYEVHAETYAGLHRQMQAVRMWLARYYLRTSLTADDAVRALRTELARHSASGEAPFERVATRSDLEQLDAKYESRTNQLSDEVSDAVNTVAAAHSRISALDNALSEQLRDVLRQVIYRHPGLLVSFWRAFLQWSRYMARKAD